METSIKLPTANISASQLALWVNDMGEYYRRYFRGEKAPDTPALLLGRKVATILEHVHDSGEFPADVTEAEIKVYQQLDFLGVPERRMVQDLVPGITAEGYLDTSDEALTLIVDYKTGSRPWDEARVRNSIQLKMYALLTKELTGQIPVVGVNWMETVQVPGTSLIEFTGRVEKIYHTFTDQDLAEFKAWVIDTAHDIARHYAAFQGAAPSLTKALEAYQEARQALEEAKAAEATARADYIEAMTAHGVRRAETQAGTFYSYQRRAWEYPDYVNKIAEHWKKAKAEAEENGEAEAKESTVWMFRAKTDKS